jgi:sec-independent protein translocase protein TatA
MGALMNPLHLAFIAMVALIFLGPKRLPDLAKSLGTGMREFRDTLSSATHDETDPIDVPEAAVPAPPPVPEVAPPLAPVAPPAVTPPPAPDAS